MKTFHIITFYILQMLKKGFSSISARKRFYIASRLGAMFFDYLGENLPNITIFRYTNPPKEGKNIHYNTNIFKKGENLYKTLLDLTVCKNAYKFIPSIGSGFSNICKEI